mgnify:CR=1 FL=1
MNIEDISKEFEIEFAIEKLAREMRKKLDQYRETKDKEIQKEIMKLLEDREKIYSNDNEVIKKYLEKK